MNRNERRKEEICLRVMRPGLRKLNRPATETFFSFCLLFYVHGKQLMLSLDGQLSYTVSAQA